MDAVNVKLPDGYHAYSVPSPGGGEALLPILDVVMQRKTNDMILFWHRAIEAMKFAFGRKSRMGGPLITDCPYRQTTFIKSFTNFMLESINDQKTFTTLKHYRGRKVKGEDGGTAHISILAPDGDACAITSTINLGYDQNELFCNSGA